MKDRTVEGSVQKKKNYFLLAAIPSLKNLIFPLVFRPKLSYLWWKAFQRLHLKPVCV
jgi:hypothetical protein